MSMAVGSSRGEPGRRRCQEAVYSEGCVGRGAASGAPGDSHAAAGPGQGPLPGQPGLELSETPDVL